MTETTADRTVDDILILEQIVKTLQLTATSDDCNSNCLVYALILKLLRVALLDAHHS